MGVGKSFYSGEAERNAKASQGSREKTERIYQKKEYGTLRSICYP